MTYKLSFKHKEDEAKDIRHFSVGEYGPKTFRPHYHFVFTTSSDAVAKAFKYCVHKAWKYGRYDCQLSATTKLVDECLILTDALSVFLPPFRFNLLYSPDAMDIANQMTYSALYGIDSFRSYAQRMSEQIQKDGTRPVES